MCGTLSNMSEDTDEGSIPAEDATRWIYSPEFNIWNGFQPGEPGLWELSPEEMGRLYPEVLRARG